MTGGLQSRSTHCSLERSTSTHKPRPAHSPRPPQLQESSHGFKQASCSSWTVSSYYFPLLQYLFEAPTMCWARFYLWRQSKVLMQLTQVNSDLGQHKQWKQYRDIFRERGMKKWHDSGQQSLNTCWKEPTDTELAHTRAYCSVQVLNSRESKI